MHDLQKQIKELLDAVEKAWNEGRFSEKEDKLKSLTTQLEDPDIWNDNLHAQEISKQHAKLQAQIAPWIDLRSEISDLKELAEMDDEGLK